MSPALTSDFCLDFRNLNQLWASILVETLFRLGLRQAVICPGSRSAPLTIAFANHPGIESIPILDERSASFLALGLARQHHRATALVCTSGTAGANFYPAVIEAKEAQVPLLVLTADRPPELRHCHAGQAIDQIKLLVQYPNWQAELRLPDAGMASLGYLRQTLQFAWEQTQFPQQGPVHLNIPLREPLAPLPDPSIQDLAKHFDSASFFENLGLEHIATDRSVSVSSTTASAGSITPASSITSVELFSSANITANMATKTLPELNTTQGIIVVGLAQPEQIEEYVAAIAKLSHSLGWPVLADALNPLRNHQSQLPNLVCHYDQILRHSEHQQSLRPDAVLRLGELPTSKVLRQWLGKLDCQQWIVSDRPGNFDPLHGKTQHLRCSLAPFANQIARHVAAIPDSSPAKPQTYLNHWKKLSQSTTQAITQTMAELEALREPKLHWVLSQVLPKRTPLFIANSTPTRDMEWFWQGNDLAIQPYFNRGANGIDGTLSTALGIAHGNRPSILVTGDLALLHDTNGWLFRHQLQGHLTIILLNNNGGGIFELLPIAQFEPPFEQFFATPQEVDFADLCKTYGTSYEQITSWEQLTKRVEYLPAKGIRLLELKTNRKTDTQWRSHLLANASLQIA